YEINLAALLADLNTNAWHSLNPGDIYAYHFDTNSSTAASGSTGLAFLDARGLLSYRYNGNVASLGSINGMFPSVANNFQFDWIDGYANGPVRPLGESLALIVNPNPQLNDNPAPPWPGAESPRKFFTLHDLFDAQKLPSATGFRARLQQASSGRS